MKSVSEQIQKILTSNALDVNAGLTFDQIHEKLVNGQMNVLYQKHNKFSVKHFKDYILSEFEDKKNNLIKQEKDMPDNGFVVLQKYGLIKYGRYISDMRIQCWDCGSNLLPILLDDETLALVPSGTYWKIAEESGQKYGYVFKHIDLKNRVCECSKHPAFKRNAIKVNISVKNGKLIFKNFFRNETIFDIPKADKNSGINSLLGRAELATYLATQNVGFGQMGNMSIGIFLRSDGKQILIADPSTPSGNDRTKIKDHEYLGRICLDMWRWMCADISVLKKHNEPVGEISKSGHYSEAIKAKVVPGNWTIEHYYDINPDKRIYSKLYLND